MKTTFSITLSLVTLWLGQAAASAGVANGPFTAGEILLNNYGGANVQRYTASGGLEQTFTGIGVEWRGASLTPTGNLVTSFDSPQEGIDIFNPAGTNIGAFVTGNDIQGDVSVFANGTLALNDQSNSTVQLYTQGGASLGNVSLPGVTDPLGNTVGSDNVLYVAGLLSGNIGKVSQSGSFLGTISLSFNPGDLVMNPTDGTLWVSDYNNDLVKHITTSGTVLGSFSIGLTGFFYGIALASDWNSLYVTTQSSTVIRHLSLTGTQLGDFNIVSPNLPAFVTVVPGPVPEPSTWTMLAAGAASLLALRRNRK